MSPMNRPTTLQEPLRFDRICLEKVWGGRRLEGAVGIKLPGTGPIGETWELVDRADYVSVVADGPWKGATLTELVRDRARELMGKAKLTPEGRFPAHREVPRRVRAAQRASASAVGHAR
jgi:mannose-6-phosphate isomerase class I